MRLRSSFASEPTSSGKQLARRAAAIEAWSAITDDHDDARFYGERTARFEAEASALRVEARIEVWAAPFVIVGVCDGRGFYLRERHGSYQVTIAPDEDPGSDPWKAAWTESSIDVDSGDDAEFGSGGEEWAAAALRIAVGAVRGALARNSCDHVGIESDPYCPRCGVPLAEAASWRWSTQDADGSA